MSGVRTPKAHLVPTYTFREGRGTCGEGVPEAVRRERAGRERAGECAAGGGPAGMDGAAYRTRTDDLMLTRQL